MSTRGQGAFQTFSAGAFFDNDTDRACIAQLDLAARMVAGDLPAIIGSDLTYAYMSRTPRPDAVACSCACARRCRAP